MAFVLTGFFYFFVFFFHACYFTKIISTRISTSILGIFQYQRLDVIDLQGIDT